MMSDLKHPREVGPRVNLLWVGVDLDGTLAEGIWTPENNSSEIGSPIWENVDQVRALHDIGYKIHIHSSRPWTDYERVETWLCYYGIPFKDIQLGKPLYVAYIDDRAVHADENWVTRVAKIAERDWKDVGSL
jgi:hypothetical protein